MQVLGQALKVKLPSGIPAGGKVSALIGLLMIHVYAPSGGSCPCSHVHTTLRSLSSTQDLSK